MTGEVGEEVCLIGILRVDCRGDGSLHVLNIVGEQRDWKEDLEGWVFLQAYMKLSIYLHRDIPPKSTFLK